MLKGDFYQLDNKLKKMDKIKNIVQVISLDDHSNNNYKDLALTNDGHAYEIKPHDIFIRIPELDNIFEISGDNKKFLDKNGNLYHSY